MPKVMKGRGVSNMAHVRPSVISSFILKGGQTKKMVAKDFTWDQRLLSQPSGFPRGPDKPRTFGVFLRRWESPTNMINITTIFKRA